MCAVLQSAESSHTSPPCPLFQAIQQWRLPGAAANTSTLCCATLAPKEQELFHCRHASSNTSITGLTQDTQQMCQGHHCLPLEDPFFGILSTHLLPCASHSLSTKLCFACFPPTALGSSLSRPVKYSCE